MNLIDIVLGAILLIAFYIGFKRGFFLALASLIGVIAGVYCAIYFSDFAAAYISRWFDWSEQTVNMVAFAITFLGVLILVSMAGKFLTKIADFAMLGVFNKLLGGVFNVLKYAFIVSVVFMYVDASEKYSIMTAEKRQESVLYDPVASLAPVILPHILREIDDFNIEAEPDLESVPEENQAR